MKSIDDIPPMSQDQFDVLNAVNTGSKALINLCHGEEWRNPNELDSTFMDLQGTQPTWEISRGYVRSVSLNQPLRSGTIEVAEAPRVFRWTDFGKYVGVPVASTLLTVADLFGVRQTLLSGECKTGTEAINPIELKYRAAYLFPDSTGVGTTGDKMAEKLDCGLSTASSMIRLYRAAGFMVPSPGLKPLRNGYAAYEISSAFDPDTLPFPNTDKTDVGLEVYEHLYYLGSTEAPIDPVTTAKKLGFTAQFAGCAIADYFEELEVAGILNKISDEELRSQSFDMTTRGINAFRAMRLLYSDIDKPTPDFLKRGNKLKDNITHDPDTVKRILAREPAKRGQKKPAINGSDREIPAVDVLLRHLAGIDTFTAARAQVLAGTSLTATCRLLNEAHMQGKLTKIPAGKRNIWKKVN